MLLAGLCLIVTGCGSSSQLLYERERDLPKWQQYDGADAARIYLAYVDESYDIAARELSNTYQSDPSKPSWQFGGDLAQIILGSPTLLVGGKGGLRYYWPDRYGWVTSPLRLQPVPHALQLQSVRAQEYGDGPLHTPIIDIDARLEPNGVYALIAFRDRKGLYNHLLLNLGRVGGAKKATPPDKNAPDDQLVELGKTKVTTFLYRKITTHISEIARIANSGNPDMYVK